MHAGEAPAFEQDQPERSALDVMLADAGVPRSLSPAQLQFARENDLRLDGEEGSEEGDAGDGNPADGDQPKPGEESSTSLDNFDPTQIPEDADRDWLAERHQQLVADYTKKTQAIKAEGASPEAQQAQEVLDSLRNPATVAQTMRLLGLDQPNVLGALGYDIEGGEEDQFVDTDDRVDALEQRLQNEQQLRQAAQAEVEDDELFMEQVEAIEETEKTEFSDEEVAFLLSHAKTNRTPQGAPNVQGARALLKGIVDRQQAAWIESRKTEKKVNGGIPARDKADLSTREGRQKHAAAVVAAKLAEGSS